MIKWIGKIAGISHMPNPVPTGFQAFFPPFSEFFFGKPLSPT
jgi:hypothetical protein